MINKKHVFWMYHFLVISMLFWLYACAVNPVTGKRELMLLSENDEIKLGTETDKQIVQMYGIYNDDKILKYIDGIGQEMVKVSHRAQLKFEFKVMDSPVINAFAVPGGFVYLTRGILAYLNNEAELAGVIGHEIGHVTARHSAKQYSKAQLAQVGLGVGSILSESFANYAGLASQGVGLLFLKFSRDNEHQSDQLGVEYATKVNYDAREMANFFATLDKMSAGAEGSLPSWFSTHPNPADRVLSVRQEAEAKQKSINKSNLKIRRNTFLNTISGLVYGEDPQQGFVENNMFYHPSLTFKFPLPAGWKTVNLPTQVQVASPDDQAAIIFTLASESSPAEAANGFVSGSQATVISQNDVKVNNFSAVKLVSTLASQSGTLKILSYFISKSNSVFVFHGFSDQASFDSYQSSFQSTMEGFNNLTDKAILNVKPDRIRIKQTSKALTLREALTSFGVSADGLEDMALLNGMELNDKLKASTSLKTIEKGR